MRWFGVALAIVSFGVALAVRFGLASYLPDGIPFLTFFPAVMLTAFLGGTVAGVLCALLSLCAAWYWFIPPAQSFALDFQNGVAMGFFVFVIIVALVIIHIMNRAIESLTAERELTRQLAEKHQRMADQQRTLFQELQHRVANNLSLISALIRLQQSRLGDQSEAKAALSDVRMRMETMARVHRQLNDPDHQTREAGAHLRGICADLLAASGRGDVACEVRADDLSFEAEQLMTVSMLVTEVITNSLKHAFGSGPGRILIELRREAGAMISLTIRDDGPGLPDGFDPEQSQQLGFRILAGFARSLGGEIVYENDRGAVTRLVFPAAKSVAE